MAERLLAFDWSQTSLGPIATWPASLRAAVGICMNSRFPMFVWWGPELVNIYNDAYIPVLGQRHPVALGQGAREIWSDIWPVIGDDVRGVLERGEPVYKERARLVMERNGFTEETYFTYSHSPIPDDEGGIGGLFQVCRDETSAVLAEQARDRETEKRREADERAVTILESITDAFFSVDHHWRFTYVNRRAESILERKPGDLLGCDLWDVYPGLRGSEFEQAYRRTMDDRVVSSAMAFYPDHARWYEVQVYPSSDGIAIYFRDVTERQRAEQERLGLSAELARRSRVFDTTLSSISDFAYTFDREGRFVYINKALLDLWGLPLEQAVGKNFYDLGYPDDLAARLERQIRHVLETGERISDETPYTSPTGARGYYEYRFSPVFAADGTIEAVAGTTRDITDRKLLELDRERLVGSLEAEKANLAAVIEHAPAFMCTLRGPSHVFELVNPRYQELVGGRELVGKTVREALPEVEGQGFVELLDEVYRTGTSYVGNEVPVRLHTRDGGVQERFLSFVYQALREADGSISGIFVHGVDVTEQRRLQKEREQMLVHERFARAEAERVGRMKDEFLATLGHELRTPLNAMLGWAQILGRENVEPDVAKRGLDAIERNARAQAQLIEDLLDMSRIVSGKVRLDVQSIDLFGVVDAALDVVRPTAEAKGVRLQRTVDPRAGTVFGDPNRLQQVLWNLLTNAIKFTPKGGRVQVVLQRIDSHVEIRVIDTGDGIDPRFLPHVFDRFSQADPSITRHFGGLGLGLSIVKSLVEMHGGTIRAQSEGVGRGATFVIALPLEAARCDRSTASSVQRPPTDHTATAEAQRARLSGIRVLVIDDEDDARVLVRYILESRGATVLTASSAREALLLVEREKPRLIVSDIGMPEMDGYAFIQELRSRSFDRGGGIPAVALTAFARSEERHAALRAGYQVHVAKPVDAGELAEVCAGLVRLTVQER